MEAIERSEQSLARVPLFAGLDTASLAKLAAAARRRSFRQGEVIFRRDEPGTVLYVIVQGKVKICLTSPDGQEAALAVLGRGDCFGELAILDGQPRSADAIALERVETYALQRKDFHKVIIEDPRIAIQIMQVISQRLRHADEQIESLIFLDVYGRVAHKLLQLAETHGVRTPEGVRIDLRLTQQELASLVGTSRESVNKVMGYFSDKQYVSTDRHKITILRLADLKRHVY
jgi:CRP/FNR family cyclic AMP-dependent transcriptional regulator